MTERGPVFRAGLAVYRRRPAHHTDGPPVVFVHGSMDRAAGFSKVTRHLPDLEVVRYDRRGYGRSVDAGVADGVSGSVADLLTVLGDRPAVLVGHSLGAVIALAAAARHPESIPAVLAFEAPMPWMPWWPAGSAGGRAVDARATGSVGDAAEAFMRRIVGDARWEALPAATRDQRRREGPALMADLASIRGAAPFDPAAVGQPVISAHGSASDERHVRAALALVELLPDAESAVIPEAGHLAHGSHPNDFAALVRRAVERARRGVTAD